jgi:hypothetical protein
MPKRAALPMQASGRAVLQIARFEYIMNIYHHSQPAGENIPSLFTREYIKREQITSQIVYSQFS